jgi:hypothetical protein
MSQEHLTLDRARWLCSQLAERQRVTREGFSAHEKKEHNRRRQQEELRRKQTPLNGGRKAPGDDDGAKEDSREDSIRSDWTRISFGIFAACEKLNVPGIKRTENELSCDSLECSRHESAYFRIYEKAYDKRAIGTLVAQYLKDLETKPQGAEMSSLFIGSGSSAFWVGRAMSYLGPWNKIRQICTINIALLSYWSELTRTWTTDGDPEPPTNFVKIPEGLYEPTQFRYTTMKNLQDQDEIGIAVVGADGCKYDPNKPSVYLFPTSDNIGQNTIRLIKMASIAVICCLTSDKILEKPPTGPCLRISGRKDIPCYLVTDDKLTNNKIVKAFADDNWHVVRKKEDWDIGNSSGAAPAKGTAKAAQPAE